MSDVFESLNESTKMELSIVEEDGNTYLQMVFDDKSSGRYPIGCWFLNECVLETFKPEEKQEAIRLISEVNIDCLPDDIRPIFIRKEQERIEKRRQEQAKELEEIRRRKIRRKKGSRNV